MDKKEAIIVDVDGTLAHIDPDNPRDIYDGSRVGEDILDDVISTMVSMYYNHGYSVIIVTGRRDEYLEITREWLTAKGVPFDEIYCRRAGDRKRQDAVIKKEIYEDFIEDRYDVKFVLEDRPRVVRMWRHELGLKVLQLNDVEF